MVSFVQVLATAELLLGQLVQVLATDFSLKTNLKTGERTANSSSFELWRVLLRPLVLYTQPLDTVATARGDAGVCHHVLLYLPLSCGECC